MAESGLQGKEIAPTVLTTVPYGNSGLSVWDHLDNPNRQPDKQKFFVMPPVMFMPESVEYEKSILTDQTAIHFDVQMWGENIIEAATAHLRRVTGNKDLSREQVAILPIEQVRLVWVNSAQPLSNNFKLNNEWQSYAGQHNVLQFSIAVGSPEPELCERTVERLKQRPEHLLGSVELEYVLHGTRTQRKRVTVSGVHLKRGKLYAELESVANIATGEVYLNPDDLNRLSQEVVNAVIASYATETDYIDYGDTVPLAKLVYNLLAAHQQSSGSMTAKMWKSTFWQDKNNRPDKIANYLNKVITKEDHTVRINDNEVSLLQPSNEIQTSLRAAFDLSSDDISANATGVTRKEMFEDHLRQWLKDHHNEVQWTGWNFEVKPMTLYRLNTQIAQKPSIITTDVPLRKVQHTYSVKMSFPTQSTQVEFQPTSVVDRLETLETQVASLRCGFNKLMTLEKSPDRAILLIGTGPWGEEAVELYNPLGECSPTGRMITHQIKNSTLSTTTSGCYLAATNQLIIRERCDPNIPPILYGLNDGSAKELPLPCKNSSGEPLYIDRSTTSSISSSKCISCGGIHVGELGGSERNCYQFDSAVEEWTPISPMPTGVWLAASVYLKGNNSYYVIGGGNTTQSLNKCLYRYDVQQRSWHEESPMTNGRCHHSAAPLSDSEFIVGGGKDSKKTCEVYDSTTGLWRTVGSFNIGRHGHALVNFNNDVYALGGRGARGEMLSSVEMFDRSTERWKLVKSLKFPRWFLIAVAI